MEESSFFKQPILNSPYEYPDRHWELENGQPTMKIIEKRRVAEFITPIPKPKKRRKENDQQILIDTGEIKGLSPDKYDPTSQINKLRAQVDTWRNLPENLWQVTPETARLLKHWRHHKFSNLRPFFCQVEAVETAIWLTEVAPKFGKRGKEFVEYLDDANRYSNPGLSRLALKLATGAGKTTVMSMLIAKKLGISRTSVRRILSV